MTPPLAADPAAAARHTTFAGLLALAMPLILGMGANSLMQFTDRYFLGLLGPKALAVSFPAGVTAYFGQCLFSGVASYTATFAAQHHGAGQHRRCGGWVWPALWFGMAGGLLNLACIPLLPALFSLMDPEPALRADLWRLCAWWMACALPATVMSAVNGFYAGTGRTGMVLAFNGALLALNACLNALLIFGLCGLPRLGTVGAGIGTFSATCLVALAAGACFLSPGNRRTYGTWDAPRWDAARLARFLRFAAPQGARTFLEIAAWTFFAFAVGRLGTEALAANNIVLNWNLLTFIPMVGLGQAISVAVGQAIGAGRPDLARRAAHRGVALEVVYGLLVGAALIGCSDWLIRPFLHVDPLADPGISVERILATARHLLVIAALWGIGDALNLAYTGALGGAGDTRCPMAAALVGSVVFLVLPLAFVLGVDASTWQRWGLEPVVAAWLSTLLFVSGIGAVMAWRFYRGPWMRMSVRQ
jgi:MATE family multidrug resistance protein